MNKPSMIIIKSCIKWLSLICILLLINLFFNNTILTIVCAFIGLVMTTVECKYLLTKSKLVDNHNTIAKGIKWDSSVDSQHNMVFGKSRAGRSRADIYQDEPTINNEEHLPFREGNN